MQTVVEMPSYLRAAEAIFSAAEREEIVWMLATDPECGEVMQGTGGFRKVRVGRGGMGKRGGARVVYIARNEGFPVFLVTASSISPVVGYPAAGVRWRFLWWKTPIGVETPATPTGEMLMPRTKRTT